MYARVCAVLVCPSHSGAVSILPVFRFISLAIERRRMCVAGTPKDIDGVPYNSKCTPQINLGIDPNRPSWASDVFVAFRNYMEPATAFSADSNELLWDRATYFGLYFSEQ
jgi:hypothetical protein